MTESGSGSSLLQAQGDTHSTPHQHSHNHHIRSHKHQILHQHHQQQQQELEKKEDHSAEEEDPSSIVHIIQNIDIIEVIDGTGATVSVKTVASPPTTTHSAPTNRQSAFRAPKVAVPDDAAADPLYTLIPTPTPSLDISAASLSMSPSFPTVESYAKITSTPLSSGSASGAFPSFSGVANATTPTTQPISPTPTPTSLFSNSTHTLKPILETNLTTSTLPNSSGTVLFNASFTTTLSHSPINSIASSTVASAHATPTSSDDDGSVGIFGGGGDGDSAPGSSPSATLPPSGDAGSGSSGQLMPGTVAGSILGSIAGVAFLLVLALMLLRWKKRQNALRLNSGTVPPGLLTGAGMGAGAGGGGGRNSNPFNDPPSPTSPTATSSMTQRRSVPFVIPAALANLTGSQKRDSERSDTSPEGGEKGFQKVSGRKLPSVLHFGGDGFSEPSDRDTVMSDQSYYRDSQGGTIGGPGIPRLAVGSPMRPESGIPVFHAGPARVPQQEIGHFRPGTLEPPSRDPLGRSHPSHDGSSRSHGSFSRFTEEI